MKRYALSIACLVIMALPTIAIAQSAKEAFLALKKMEARIQAGISVRDYSGALGETKFPVNLYLEGSEANENRELSVLIGKVMKHYENIGVIREGIIPGPYRPLKMKPEFNTFLEQYPEANKFKGVGGALDGDGSDKVGPVLRLDYLLPIIEKKWSEDLKKLSSMFAQADVKAKDNKINIEKLMEENTKLKSENLQMKEENNKLSSQIESLKSSLRKKK
jgi:hypothetical protein